MFVTDESDALSKPRKKSFFSFPKKKKKKENVESDEVITNPNLDDEAEEEPEKGTTV